MEILMWRSKEMKMKCVCVFNYFVFLECGEQNIKKKDIFFGVFLIFKILNLNNNNLNNIREYI